MFENRKFLNPEWEIIEVQVRSSGFIIMKFASATHVGRVRQENEDYLIAKDGIFIVADGMGGHKAGDIASKLAAQTVYKVISSTDFEEKLTILKKAVAAANKKVIEKSQHIQSQNGMGTTLTLTYIDGSSAYFAHIGDSRAYLLRDGKLKQITEDHSLVAEMVKQGKITNKEAREHPYRNVITKAIGSDVQVQADYFSIAIKPGDRFLLASDGLTNMLKDGQIKKLISETSLKEASQKLIKTSNDNGGSDNITVILIDITDNKVTKTVGKKPPWGLRIAVSALIALSIFGAILSGYYLNKNTYYLTTHKGKVAMYRGLPYKLFGLKFSKLSFISGVEYQDLDTAMKKRLKKKIVVRNRKDGLQAIKDMQQEGGQ